MSEKARKVFKALLAVLAYALTVLLLTGNVKADIYSGLVAYYPFNGDAIDETGNGHDGTVYGATLTEGFNGEALSAYNFDGIDDYIDCGNTFYFNGWDNLSVSLWVVFSNLSNSARLIEKDTSFGLSWTIEINNYLSGFLDVRLRSQNTYFVASYPISNFKEGEWYHLSFTFNNDVLKLYVDGELVNTSTVNGSLQDELNEKLVIGSGYSSSTAIDFFNGVLDEVRIYNKTLSESEVRALTEFKNIKVTAFELLNVTIEYTLIYDNTTFSSDKEVNISYNNSAYEPMQYMNSSVEGNYILETYTWKGSKLPFVQNETSLEIPYSIRYALINKSSFSKQIYTINPSFYVRYGFTPLNISLSSDTVELKNETYIINARITDTSYDVRVLLQKDNGSLTNYTATLISRKGIVNTYKVMLLTDEVETSQYMTENFKPFLIVQDDSGENRSRNISEVSQRIHNFSMALTTSTCPSGNSYASYFEALNVDIDLEENPSNTVATSSVVENHFYLTPQDGTEFYFSPSIDTNTNSYKVCIYPDFTNVTVSDWSDIYYYSNLNNSDETFKRYYWFSPGCTKLSKDIVKNVQLYAFGDADLPYPDDYLTVSIQVKDSQGSAVQDAIVKVLKRFPDGTYKTVEVTKTNTDGTAVAKVVAYRALYKFIVEKDCEALFESQPLQISQSTLTITLPAGTATNPFFDYYQFLLTLFFNLNYTDTEWKLTFTDTSNVVKTHCLQVFEKSFPSWVKKNEQCVTSTAGTITLDRDSSKTQQAVYTVNGIPIALLTSEEANPARQTFKNVGGGFIPIILTMLAMGVSMMIASPSAFFFIEPLILLISHKLGWIAATSATLYGFAILLVVIGVLLSVKKT